MSKVYSCPPIETRKRFEPSGYGCDPDGSLIQKKPEPLSFIYFQSQPF